MVHSKHGVTPGIITLAWPLNPSVPPSTIGFIVSSLGLSSASYSEYAKPNGQKQNHKGVKKKAVHITDINAVRE